MTTEYRMLEKGELVIEGDEFQRYLEGPWHESADWRVAKGKQAAEPGYRYRRPVVRNRHHPQWRHPDAPSCPVHVLWAESPSTVRTVAQVAAEAKPEPVEPGTGYRLLGDDEIVEKGDERYNPGSSRGDWCRATGSVGNVVGTMAYTYRRNLLVHEPQYRPYANAAEAAEGPQGKLICRKNFEIWRTVAQIDWAGATVDEDCVSFAGLQKYWKFTDGTPCGVLTTNQGTK